MLLKQAVVPKFELKACADCAVQHRSRKAGHQTPRAAKPAKCSRTRLLLLPVHCPGKWAGWKNFWHPFAECKGWWIQWCIRTVLRFLFWQCRNVFLCFFVTPRCLFESGGQTHTSKILWNLTRAKHMIPYPSPLSTFARENTSYWSMKFGKSSKSDLPIQKHSLHQRASRWDQTQSTVYKCGKTTLMVESPCTQDPSAALFKILRRFLGQSVRKRRQSHLIREREEINNITGKTGTWQVQFFFYRLYTFKRLDHHSATQISLQQLQQSWPLSMPELLTWFGHPLC